MSDSNEKDIFNDLIDDCNNYDEEEEEEKYYSISVVCSEEAKNTIMEVLEKFKDLGSYGSSREVIVEDDDDTLATCFDGDGSAYIDSLTCKKLSTDDKKVIETTKDKKRQLTIALNAIERSLETLEKEEE